MTDSIDALGAALDKAALAAAAPEIALPLKVLTWVKAHVLPIVMVVVAIALFIAVEAFGLNLFSGAKRAAATAQVSSASDSAANASGADAVSAVEAQDAADSTTTRTVSHAQAAVSAAPDPADADAAGRSGLCAISPDLCPAAGVQQPAAR